VRTEDLINNIITGNATDQEKQMLNAWLKKSEDNQKQFDQQELIWSLLEKVEKRRDFFKY
jgi:ferric-dicitrate binding protein FerR (iron transport regulator)